MKQAVKTEERAMNALYQAIIHNTPCTIEEITGRCECGETTALVVKTRAGVIIAKVAICEQCGDDDLMNSEILYVY
jgi:hypothetical protein